MQPYDHSTAKIDRLMFVLDGRKDQTLGVEGANQN
jgi:hypothetical protein